MKPVTSLKGESSPYKSMKRVRSLNMRWKTYVPVNNAYGKYQSVSLKTPPGEFLRRSEGAHV